MKKEKFTREITIVVPPSLFENFNQKCNNKFKTVSEVLRELMLSYVKEEDEKNA